MLLVAPADGGRFSLMGLECEQSDPCDQALDLQLHLSVLNGRKWHELDARQPYRAGTNLISTKVAQIEDYLNEA